MTMYLWRVVHIDVNRRRRRLRVEAPSNGAALAWANQLFGDARCAAVTRIGVGKR